MVEPDNKWGGGGFSDNGPKTVYVFSFPSKVLPVMELLRSKTFGSPQQDDWDKLVICMHIYFKVFNNIKSHLGIL